MKDVTEMTAEELLEAYADEVDGESRRISSDPPSRAAEIKQEILDRLEDSN